MAYYVVNPAFPYFGYLQHPVGDNLAEVEFSAQVRHDFVLEQPFHLEGNARKGKDDTARVFDDKGRRCAIRVLDWNSSLWYVGLPLVVGRHNEAATLETLL